MVFVPALVYNLLIMEPKLTPEQEAIIDRWMEEDAAFAFSADDIAEGLGIHSNGEATRGVVFGAMIAQLPPKAIEQKKGPWASVVSV